MAVKKINNENFENEILSQEGLSLIDFYADWCGPCKMVSPIVDEIAEERSDVVVGKVNVDDNPELASKYGVMSIPTLVVIKNGKEHARIVGHKPKAEILAMLG